MSALPFAPLSSPLSFFVLSLSLSGKITDVEYAHVSPQMREKLYRFILAKAEREEGRERERFEVCSSSIDNFGHGLESIQKAILQFIPLLSLILPSAANAYWAFSRWRKRGESCGGGGGSGGHVCCCWCWWCCG